MTKRPFPKTTSFSVEKFEKFSRRELQTRPSIDVAIVADEADRDEAAVREADARERLRRCPTRPPTRSTASVEVRIVPLSPTATKRPSP